MVERRVHFVVILFVLVRVVTDELGRHADALKDVYHTHLLAFVSVTLVLILVNLQHHVMSPTIEHKVRSVLETTTVLDHFVATHISVPVHIKHVFDLILFRQSGSIELVGVTHSAITLLVQNVQ